MQATNYRELSYQSWQAAATAWERERDHVWRAAEVVSRWMVDHLEPRPGDVVLDLAAGTGDTGFLAAQRIGPRGRLLSTDRSPAMLQAAQRRAAALGLSNVEFKVLDAEHMDLPDAGVGGVLCRWGYMLMADPAAAFRETRRVLRPGRRVCFAVWGPEQRNAWTTIMARVMVAGGFLPPPDPSAPGMFTLSDPAALTGLVTSAGLTRPHIEEIEVLWRFASFEEFWRVLTSLSTMITRALSEMSGDQRDGVRAAVLEGLERYRAADGYELPGMSLGVCSLRAA
ncbi:MAG: class I SAM-dependent methyltransferase [Gaiellales bacterium]